MAETTAKNKPIRIDSRKPTFQVKDGEVLKILPEEIEVEESQEETGTTEIPTYRIQTDAGEAVYEYYGDCADCANEGVVTSIFRCITKIRADAEIGNQLAAGWNDGGTATPLCQNHYRHRMKGIAQPPPGYKVIERRW